MRKLELAKTIGQMIIIPALGIGAGLTTYDILSSKIQVLNDQDAWNTMIPDKEVTKREIYRTLGLYGISLTVEAVTIATMVKASDTIITGVSDILRK